jgi:hypothetical protein
LNHLALKLKLVELFLCWPHCQTKVPLFSNTRYSNVYVYFLTLFWMETDKFWKIMAAKRFMKCVILESRISNRVRYT